MLYLNTQEDVLSIEFRKKVIEDILAPQNYDRKREAKKRQELYKDRAPQWVMQNMQKMGLAYSTLQIMEGRTANIGFLKKIVKKLARSYNNGVERNISPMSIQDEQQRKLTQVQLEELYKHLNFDEKQKKADRYCKLQKTVFVATMPELVSQVKDKKYYCLKQVVMSPWEYDVVPLSKDKEKAGVLILSDFQDYQSSAVISNSPKVSTNQLQNPTYTQAPSIAIAPGATLTTNKKCEFIWWTDKYHFTTNVEGDIIPDLSPEDNLNPIEIMPGTTYAEDQDGTYWADGGADLVDGAILLNTQLTDLYSIQYIQGFGQFVVTGKNIAGKLAMGPHMALMLNYDPSQEEPEPKVYVVNGQPPIGDWLSSIEQYVAMWLTTNDIAPSEVAVKLDARETASGIAMLIEKSVANNDISSMQNQYRMGEIHQFEVAKRWQNYLYMTDSLVDDYKEIGPINEMATINLKFNESKELLKESEHLDNIKKRKEIGLNTTVELIMKDNPGMSEEDAKKKMHDIMAEKAMMQPMNEEMSDEDMADENRFKPGTKTNAKKQVEYDPNDAQA